MTRLLATVLMLGGLTFSPLYAVAQAGDSKDKAQIERVIETFRAAIVNKDEEAFLGLFLKEDITGPAYSPTRVSKGCTQIAPSLK